MTLTNKQVVNRVLPHSEYRLKNTQSNSIFTSFSMNLVSRNIYTFFDNLKKVSYQKFDMLSHIINDGDDIITDPNQLYSAVEDSLYQVYDLPFTAEGNNIPVFIKRFDLCVINKYIDPFLMVSETFDENEYGKTLKSSVVIPWNKIVVIKNYDYTYFLFIDKNVYLNTSDNIKCMKINPSAKYRLGKDTLVDTPITYGLMIKSNGTITDNPEEAEFGIDLNYKGTSTHICLSTFSVSNTINGVQEEFIQGITTGVDLVENNFEDGREGYKESEVLNYSNKYSALGSPGSYFYFATDFIVPISNILIITDTGDLIIEPYNILDNPFDNLFMFKENTDSTYDINSLNIKEIMVFFDTRTTNSYSHTMKYISQSNRMRLIGDILYNSSIDLKDEYITKIENMFKNKFDINIRDYMDESGLVDYDQIYSDIDNYDKRIPFDEQQKIKDVHCKYLSSYTMSGKELKSMIVNGDQVIMNRSYWKDENYPDRLNGFNYIMIFHNNLLYEKLGSIKYEGANFRFTAEPDEINDDDIFEFMYISRSNEKVCNLENSLSNIVEKKIDSSHYVLKTSPSYDLTKCNIFENDPKNNTVLLDVINNTNGNDEFPFIHFDKKNYEVSTNVFDILLGADCITHYDEYEGNSSNTTGVYYLLDISSFPDEYIDAFEDMFMGADSSNKCNLSIVPKEHCRYYHYLYNPENFNAILDEGTGTVTERSEDVACLLPEKFKYCRNVSQYMVFVNGIRITDEALFIAMPAQDNPFDELVLYISYPFGKDDNIDIFYLPFQMYDDQDFVKNSDTGRNNILLFDKNKQVIDISNTMIFADGRKISPDDIEIKGKSILKIMDDTNYRNIRCTYVLPPGEDINIYNSDSWIDSVEELEWKYLHRLFDDILDPVWVNKDDPNVENTEETFESQAYDRMGIIVQAYKDYYGAYIINGNTAIQYTGEDILYNYKEGDSSKEPAIVRIFDGSAEIHPDIEK